MPKTEDHPSARRRIREVANRFLAARKAHALASERMWIGTLVVEFTDEDLDVFRSLNYLNGIDEALIKAAKR
jgi:hypothetical protein